MSLWRWSGGASVGLVSALVFGLLGCAPRGAKGAGNGGAPDLDTDPLALLPAGPTVVGTLDARAAFASAFGPALGGAMAALLPLPESAGFIPARDINRVVAAGYPASTPEVAVVLSGRFDPSRITGATQTRSGAAIVAGTFAGFATETAGQVTFAAITPKTLVAGTQSGVQAVLDRIRQGQLARAVSPQVVATLQSAGAQAALVADFTTQPARVGSIGMVNLGWVQGVKLVRALGDFNPPGLNVAATSSFANPAQATAAVSGIHALDGWLTILAPALGGARIQNLQVEAVGSDVTTKFAVDGASLAALLALGTRFIPTP